MAQVINISDKFSLDKPTLKVGEHTFTVNDSLTVATKFQELASSPDMDNMKEAITLVLGDDALEKLDYDNLSLGNFKVLNIAIMAAIQDIPYEEAAERFQE